MATNPSQEKSVFKCVNLCHRYSTKQWVLKDFNLSITEPGIYGLLGSNGAGKSTFLNIMCGVLSQTSGEVYLNGCNLNNQPLVAKSQIGFLPQKPPLQMDLTVQEYLEYCAELHRMDPASIPDAVKEVMARCNISHFANRLIRNLSGGYQQRVGIAQAIIHKPAIIVLDEPTNGLDPNQIKGVRELICSIAKDCTVILSTHILAEVQVICEHILMIEQGKLIFSGTTEEFDNYVAPDSIDVTLLNAPSVEELKEKTASNSVTVIGENQFRLQMEKAQSHLEQIVECCVSQGWRLQEITLIRKSMDDIFAFLSQKSANSSKSNTEK